jgi:hypothetical protein
MTSAAIAQHLGRKARISYCRGQRVGGRSRWIEGDGRGIAFISTVDAETPATWDNALRTVIGQAAQVMCSTPSVTVCGSAAKADPESKRNEITAALNMLRS